MPASHVPRHRVASPSASSMRSASRGSPGGGSPASPARGGGGKLPHWSGAEQRPHTSVSITRFDESSLGPSASLRVGTADTRGTKATMATRASGVTAASRTSDRSDFTGMLLWRRREGDVASRDNAAHGYSYTAQPEGWRETVKFRQGPRFDPKATKTEGPPLGIYNVPTDTLHLPRPSSVRSETFGRRLRATAPVSGAAAELRLGGADPLLEQDPLGPGSYDSPAMMDVGEKGATSALYRSTTPRFPGDPRGDGLLAVQHRAPKSARRAAANRKKGAAVATEAKKRVKSAPRQRRRTEGDLTGARPATTARASAFESLPPAGSPVDARPCKGVHGSIFVTPGEMAGGGPTGPVAALSYFPLTVTQGGLHEMLDSSSLVTSPIKGRSMSSPQLIGPDVLSSSIQQAARRVHGVTKRAPPMAKRAWSPQLGPRAVPSAAALRDDFERKQEQAFVEGLDAHGLRTQGLFQKSRNTERKALATRQALEQEKAERARHAREARAARESARLSVKARKLQLGGSVEVPALWA